MFKKIFPFAIAITLLAWGAGPALAETGTKKAELHYNNIKVIVNGDLVQTSSEPFIIDGVTYVPLRDVSSALGAGVEWDAANNTVLISNAVDETSTNDNVIEDTGDEVVEKSESDEELAVESELDKLGNILLERNGVLNGVYFNSFGLEGDSRAITLNIGFDLAEDLEAWGALTDRDITNWLTNVTEDVQKAYNRNTMVRGSIIREDNKNSIIDFRKDGTERLRTNFYDGNLRTGVAVRTQLPVEGDYLSKRFSIEGIDFRVTSVTLRRDNDTLDIAFNAVNSGANFDWDRLSAQQKRNAASKVGEVIANDFYNDAGISLERVNCTFRDTTSRGLGLFRYDVEEGAIIR